MTRDEALAILDMERKQAVEVILILAQKAERYDKGASRGESHNPLRHDPCLFKAGSWETKEAAGEERRPSRGVPQGPAKDRSL